MLDIIYWRMLLLALVKYGNLTSTLDEGVLRLQVTHASPTHPLMPQAAESLSADTSPCASLDAGIAKFLEWKEWVQTSRRVLERQVTWYKDRQDDVCGVICWLEEIGPILSSISGQITSRLECLAKKRSEMQQKIESYHGALDSLRKMKEDEGQ